MLRAVGKLVAHQRLGALPHPRPGAVRCRHREGRANGTRTATYADAISKVGWCSTLNDTERAIKHFSAAASCRRRAVFSSDPAASLACGHNVTLFEFPSAVRLLDLNSRGAVAICYDDDTCLGTKVEIPELMTGGKRGDEQFRWIPSRRVAGDGEPNPRVTRMAPGPNGQPSPSRSRGRRRAVGFRDGATDALPCRGHQRNFSL
jgi:hypothetical protein